MRLLGSRFLFLAVLFAIPLAGLVGSEWLARRRADEARAALHIGNGCGELLAVAERLANIDSLADARRACNGSRPAQATLNFSVGVSLNYLVTVDVADGRLVSVSAIGAW